MKVLFVCRQNAVRSQIAEAFFRGLYQEHEARSAGTHVMQEESKPLNQFVIECMRETGYDLASNYRKQLTPEMIEWADRVISMTEPEDIDRYISPGKVTFWNINNSNEILPYEFHRRIRGEIKGLVEKLGEELLGAER